MAYPLLAHGNARIPNIFPLTCCGQTLKNQWEGYATRTDFSVTTNNHTWLQDSVIAIITGASEPGEVILIGGHLDSINSANTNAAPGADDNASGIAVVSEILRVMLASDFKPQRTLKFIGYSTEEVGLRGSREIAKDMVDDPAIDVIAALQFDMTGFSGSANTMALAYIGSLMVTHLVAMPALITQHGPA